MHSGSKMEGEEVTKSDHFNQKLRVSLVVGARPLTPQSVKERPAIIHSCLLQRVFLVPFNICACPVHIREARCGVNLLPIILQESAQPLVSCVC